MKSSKGSSFGFTSKVKKVRCAKNGTMKPGQQNIAMSYADPPSIQEQNRDNGRWRTNRNYEQPQPRQEYFVDPYSQQPAFFYTRDNTFQSGFDPSQIVYDDPSTYYPQQ